MDLSNLDFKRILPQFMREDAAVLGLSAGLDTIVPDLAASLKLLSTWNYLDELPERDLDDLAEELNMYWYDKGASIETKRELIRNAVDVHRHMGTKWAVESVITSYFGDGFISEWFEYDGDPMHFRVYSNNPSLTEENLIAFMNLLNKVKRASAILDGIFITLSGQMSLYAGTALHETGTEQYEIGAKPL